MLKNKNIIEKVIFFFIFFIISFSLGYSSLNRFDPRVEPKTKEFVEILSALKVNGKKVLLLTNGNQDAVYKSGRNISKVKILEASKASAYDILNNQVLIIQQGAINLIAKSFGNNNVSEN